MMSTAACSESVQTLISSTYTCTKLCQPYFEAYLDCTNPLSCTKVNLQLDSLPMISSLIFQIPSGPSASNDQVSITNYE